MPATRSPILVSEPGADGAARRLPHVRFDTTPLAPERRLAAFRDAWGALFELEPAEPDAAERPVVMDAWQLGGALLMTGGGPGFRLERTAGAIARDARDLFMLQMHLAGQCRILQGGPEMATEPGDLMLIDAAQPTAAMETGGSDICLLMPRPLLAPLLRQPDGHGRRVMPRDRPLVQLVRRHLTELAAEAPRLAEAHAPPLLQATLQLVAAAVNAEPGPDTAPGVRAALGGALRQHIEQALDDRTLDAAALAARFGLSRAGVYRLFEADGGVRRYIQQRRLERARRWLTDAAANHRTVAEIGAAAGYDHAQDFVRAYRRAFGITPGEQRDGARAEARRRLRPLPDERPTWSEWIRRVR